MVTLYQGGMPWERVEQRFGVSSSTVRNYLKVGGVLVRDAHSRNRSAPGSLLG